MCIEQNFHIVESQRQCGKTSLLLHSAISGATRVLADKVSLGRSCYAEFTLSSLAVVGKSGTQQPLGAICVPAAFAVAMLAFD